MKTKIFLLFLFVVSGAGRLLHAQNVHGRVVNESRLAQPYTTVILYNSDSVMVGGTVSDSLGNFLFDYGKTPFLLEIRHISYASAKIQFHTLACGDVVLGESANALKEVVVMGDHPAVAIDKGGGLTYSAEVLRSRHKVANTAYDLITKLPGVMEQGGSLSLIGTNGLTVVINGKVSSMSVGQLFAILQSTPAERVTSLRVMYNPPPKYRTRGAVIDVVLNRAIQFQAEAHSEFQNTHVASWKAGTNIVLPSDNIALDFSYEFATMGKYTDIDFNGKHNLQGTMYDISQYQTIRGRNNGHQVRLGVDAKLSEKSQLNGAYNGSYVPKSYSLTNSSGTLFTSANQKDGDNYTHNFSLGYRHDAGWDVNADFTSYRLSQEQQLLNVSGMISTSYSETATQKVDRFLFSIDKRLAWGQAGAFTIGSSNSLSKSRDESQTSAGNSLSKLTERNFSVYAGFERRFTNQLTASAYLTGEYYKRNDLEKWLVYPQGSLTYVLSPIHIFQVTFSSERKYPTFWQMQNTVSYLDGYSEIHGNLGLLPLQRYHGTLLYLHKQKYITQLFYTYDDDYFQQSAYQDPSQLKLIYETKNWDYSKTLGLNLIVPFGFTPMVNHRLTLGVSNNQVSTNDFYSNRIHRSKWVGLMHLSNNFTLSSKPNISAELSAHYQTPSIQTVYDLNASWACNLSVKYTSPSKRLSISLIGNDLFESSVPKATVKWGTQDFAVNTGLKKRYIALRLSYSFGKYKKKDHKALDTSRFGF